jgi:hypothetical protein
MRLGGEVDNGVESLFAQERCKQTRVADIPFHESQFGASANGLQIGEVPCVGQRVHYDQAFARMLF